MRSEGAGGSENESSPSLGEDFQNRVLSSAGAPPNRGFTRHTARKHLHLGEGCRGRSEDKTRARLLHKSLGNRQQTNEGRLSGAARSPSPSSESGSRPRGGGGTGTAARQRPTAGSAAAPPPAGTGPRRRPAPPRPCAGRGGAPGPLRTRRAPPQPGHRPGDSSSLPTARPRRHGPAAPGEAGIAAPLPPLTSCLRSSSESPA